MCIYLHVYIYRVNPVPTAHLRSAQDGATKLYICVHIYMYTHTHTDTHRTAQDGTTKLSVDICMCNKLSLSMYLRISVYSNRSCRVCSGRRDQALGRHLHVQQARALQLAAHQGLHLLRRARKATMLRRQAVRTYLYMDIFIDMYI